VQWIILVDAVTPLGRRKVLPSLAQGVEIWGVGGPGDILE
jgi:hypothetical protein